MDKKIILLLKIISLISLTAYILGFLGHYNYHVLEIGNTDKILEITNTIEWNFNFVISFISKIAILVIAVVAIITIVSDKSKIKEILDSVKTDKYKTIILIFTGIVFILTLVLLRLFIIAIPMFFIYFILFNFYVLFSKRELCYLVLILFGIPVLFSITLFSTLCSIILIIYFLIIIFLIEKIEVINNK